MSRVHDALRRAEQLSGQPPVVTAPGATDAPSESAESAPVPAIFVPSADLSTDLLSRVRQIPFAPAPDAHLLSFDNPQKTPAEEFRTLRTRLNHLQSLQPLHTVVVTSPSPAEGKSFAAVNLAIAESQLEGNNTLIVDCDFRRPILHNLFQTDRSPGLTELLQGKAELEDCIRRIESSNLYIMTAGEAVVNPLELLNLREMRVLLEQLPSLFNWVLLDSPPLLFAADASLLSTMSSGAILVVRIGATTIDSVTRALGSLCEDNVIGIIVNGARRGELYSKYTYYHSYYYGANEEEEAPQEAEA